MDSHAVSDNPSPHEDFGPLRSTFQRTHREANVQRYEDELALPGRLDHILHVLFSTDPDDLELYGKPMARNSQIWTQNHKLLLDGPKATKTEIKTALQTIKQGGLFGYRFQYPPLIIESHQIYWHRPLLHIFCPMKKNPLSCPMRFPDISQLTTRSVPTLIIPLNSGHLFTKEASLKQS